MNKRSIIVNRTFPVFSGAVEIAKVSVSCAPWEVPDPKPVSPVIKLPPESPEAVVLAAVSKGLTRFEDIAKTAFGTLSATSQSKTRTALTRLKERGVVSAEQQKGKAAKWELRSAIS